MPRTASTTFHTATTRVLAALLACCALAAAALIHVPVSSAASCSAGSCTQTFNSTGTLQEWQVPAGVSSATFSVAGAGGGGGFWEPATGGSGALVTTTFTVVEGQQLKLVVGAGGEHQSSETYGGGGPGIEDSAFGGAGGGGSFIFSSAGSLLVAAGGGGGGGSENNGGNGGQVGGNGGSFEASGGGGASQSSPGTASQGAEAGQGPTTSTAIEGRGGRGSTASSEGGGSGGGGFYGGGGGGSFVIWSGGGGGGSSTVNGGSSTTIEAGVGGTGGGAFGSGAGGHITVSFTQPTTSVTELASTEEATVGETVTYTATVSPVPTDGTVSFEDEGSVIPGCSAVTVSTTTGEASCETEYEAAGIETVTANYSGSSDQIYTPATSNTEQVTVRTPTTTELKASTSTPEVGETVTYTATVAPVPTSGTIAFEDEGTPISGCEAQTVNISTGKATCEQTYGSPGTHPITAAYSGSTDTLYKPSTTSGPTTITVSTATTTELKASTNTPKVGETVTYTATVTPAPDSGTISFEDEGTPVSGCETQTVNISTGKATCEHSYGSPGAHAITAAYSGSTDTLYKPSATAAPTTVTALAGTTTELKASNSTPTVGETVTYTATVTPTPDSGTISFEDEGTPISGCEAKAVNTSTGKATCERSYASAGAHSITAAYSGSTDTLYKPSATGGPTTITVQALPKTTSPEIPGTQPSTPPTPPASTPPPAQTGQPAAADKPAVVLTKAPKGLINIRKLKVVFRCGSSACSANAKLTVTLGASHWTLTSKQGTAAADRRGTITVAVPAQLRQTVRHDLVRHHRATPTAVLAVTLTDARSTPETTNINLGVWTLPGFR